MSGFSSDTTVSSPPSPSNGFSQYKNLYANLVLSDNSRLERLDPKGCPPLGRKSHPSYRIDPVFFGFFFFFFCVPQLYLWDSPLLGEIFAYVTVFFCFFFKSKH